MIPMSTYVITITIKPQCSNNITWMMGGRRSGLKPISTYPITINTFSNIEQGKVDDIFRPTSMYFAITHTIYYLGVRVAGLGPTSNSTITTSSLSCILGVKMAGIFKPRSTSNIINSNTTFLFFMNHFLYKT